MKIFISWSGESSKRVARALRDWLPDVIQSTRPWMSDEDIAPGADSIQAIHQGLADSDFGLLCLTKDNYNAPWVLFEAGSIAKAVGKDGVCPFLIDFQAGELPAPLNIYQAVAADKQGARSLIKIINAASQDIDPLRLDEYFNIWWPKLQSTLADLAISPGPRYTPEFFYLANAESSEWLEASGAKSDKGPLACGATYSGSDRQRWSLHKVAGDYFAILSKHTGKCLDVKEESDKPGAAVHQWRYKGQKNQHWKLEKSVDDSYLLLNENSQLYLALDNSKALQLDHARSANVRWWVKSIIS